MPGILCIGCGFLLLNRLRDTPQSLGLPTVEEYRKDFSELSVKNSLDERELTLKEALVDHVLKNAEQSKIITQEQAGATQEITEMLDGLKMVSQKLLELADSSCRN